MAKIIMVSCNRPMGRLKIIISSASRSKPCRREVAPKHLLSVSCDRVPNCQTILADQQTKIVCNNSKRDICAIWLWMAQGRNSKILKREEQLAMVAPTLLLKCRATLSWTSPTKYSKANTFKISISFRSRKRCTRSPWRSVRAYSGSILHTDHST